MMPTTYVRAREQLPEFGKLLKKNWARRLVGIVTKKIL